MMPQIGVARQFDYSLARYRLAGRYYAGYWVPTTGTATAIVADRLYAMPFVTAKAHKVTQMGIYVSTGVADTLARLGIYQDDGALYPGALVLDAGTIATTATAYREITGLTQMLAPNTLYWRVLVGNGVPTLNWENTGDISGILGSANATPGGMCSGYYVAFTYAVLPATFPASATIAQSGPALCIMVNP